MDQHNLRIRAIFLTSGEEEYHSFMEDLRPINRAFTENFETLSGFAPNSPFIKEAPNAEIKHIDDLCFYFLRTEGTAKPNSLIALTEVTPESTKTPLLFPGEFLHAFSIGEVGNPAKYIQELGFIKNFQDESLIAAKYSSLMQNIAWIEMLEPNHPLISMKKEFIQKQKNALIPHIGFLLEEKMLNPYLRLNDPKLQALIESTDKQTILLKLKAFEKLQKEKTQSQSKPAGCKNSQKLPN